MSKLTDRLRTIVGPSASSHPALPTASRGQDTDLDPARDDRTGDVDIRRGKCDGETSSRGALELVLGGSWQASSGIRCFIVERRQPPKAIHGRETVGEIGARLEEASSGAALLAGDVAVAPPFVFFDLETTGLSGGAGTYAFLIGCAWFEPDGVFVTRQFVLTRVADESHLLSTAGVDIARAGTLVSFNGKSFDAPMLETRHLYHRLAWMGRGLPHLDVLHPSRRFWDGADCSLVALERRVLEVRRVGDVPGVEIPARYFQFLRSGDAAPLAPILEHNRLDLLSLAALTARLTHLVSAGPSACRDGAEALAVGRVYERAGVESLAIESYQRAAVSSSRVPALRALALAFRRARRFEDAASAWRQLLSEPGCPRPLAREAGEALAIHHEHRVRDLTLARTFALASVDETHPEWNEGVRHRVSRIERKMNRSGLLR